VLFERPKDAHDVSVASNPDRDEIPVIGRQLELHVEARQGGVKAAGRGKARSLDRETPHDPMVATLP